MALIAAEGNSVGAGGCRTRGELIVGQCDNLNRFMAPKPQVWRPSHGCI
jgi:hypothetical protein